MIDLIPRSRLRDLVAVSSFALLTAGAAQISIPLGFTPVPITGQTFAVLLAGGVLGSSALDPKGLLNPGNLIPDA